MGRVREQDIINYYCNNSHNNVTIMDAHVDMVMLMDMAMDMAMDRDMDMDMDAAFKIIIGLFGSIR